MVLALPSRIMNYKVSAVSPTDELITIGQILSEVGDYACTILDKEHLSFARKCATRLKKVVGELTSRGRIQSPDDLYEIQKGKAETVDLSAMTIDELHKLYRQWPIRHQERLNEGREHMTYYYEGLIVRELQSRRPATKDEQLKIDYCVATYHNELDNMSFVFSRPIKVDDDKIYPDSTRQYSPEELTALVKLYCDYRDVVEREILVEYVDMALDSIEKNIDLTLTTELAEIGCKGIVRVPSWVYEK